VAGESSPLAPLLVQYADYALWQRQWLQGEILQQHLAYWKKQLWRVQPLALPTDVPYALAQGNACRDSSFQFSVEQWKDLVQFSQQEGVTLFMLLLAIFQVVLYRLSGQTDIVLGTDVANRTQIETEGLIGFFVNLLALRTDLQGAPGFRKVLQQVRAMVLEAYTYQALPFEEVVEHVQAERDAYRAPVVQALFVMQNVPPAKGKLPDVTFEPVNEPSNVAKFDLAVFLYESAQGLWINTRYRTALFHEQTIVALFRRFEVLARSAIAEPDTSIDALEMYSKEEKIEQEHDEQEGYQEGRSTWRKRKKKTIDVSELTSSPVKLE
jgi:non-ribosomal peptide synthetase component F